MTRREQLTAMRPRDLIALADRLGVKVAASKNRVNLKEKKSDVVDRILFAESVDGDVAVETVDSTPLEDAESDSTEQIVELVRPEKEFDLREFLTGAKFISTPISEYVIHKRVMKNDEQIGTVATMADIVTVTTGVGEKMRVFNFPVEEYEVIRAEVG